MFHQLQDNIDNISDCITKQLFICLMSEKRQLVLYKSEDNEVIQEHFIEEAINLTLLDYIRHHVDHARMEYKRYIDKFVIKKIELDIIHKICIKLNLSEKTIRTKVGFIIKRGFKFI